MPTKLQIREIDCLQDNNPLPPHTIKINQITAVAAATETTACADLNSFVREGPTLTCFLIDEGRKDQNTTLSGPSSARQQNAI